MMIRPGIYCDIHIRQFRLQMRLHFECALIPITAATEIHRSEGTAGFIEIREPALRKAAVKRGHLEKEVT